MDPLTNDDRCGKSTRLPMMIYEDSLKRRMRKETDKLCTILVSEPRRIAAQGLYKSIHESAKAKRVRGMMNPAILV